MRSPRSRRAPSSGDSSPGPPCAAAARPALRLPAPSRGRSNAQLANLSHETPLKPHRHKPVIPRIHETSRTEFSRNPVCRNGLTHEYRARNFAQLGQKRANNAAARTKRAAGRANPRPKARKHARPVEVLYMYRTASSLRPEARPRRQPLWPARRGDGCTRARFGTQGHDRPWRVAPPRSPGHARLTMHGAGPARPAHPSVSLPPGRWGAGCHWQLAASALPPPGAAESGPAVGAVRMSRPRARCYTRVIGALPTADKSLPAARLRT
jgi:hypothetical protein